MIQFDANKFQLGWNHGTTNYSWRKFRFNITFFFTFVFSWRFYLVVQLYTKTYILQSWKVSGRIHFHFVSVWSQAWGMSISWLACVWKLWTLQSKCKHLKTKKPTNLLLIYFPDVLSKKTSPREPRKQPRLVGCFFLRVSQQHSPPNFKINSGLPWRPSFFRKRPPMDFVGVFKISHPFGRPIFFGGSCSYTPVK